MNYQIADTHDIITPALIYYKEALVENMEKAAKRAGGAHRLWPHVKTHKCAEMVRLMMAVGIYKFKCATIAEAEMAATCGASDIILAYPLVGPNIGRFLTLAQAFPDVAFWAVGDDMRQLRLLAEASCRMPDTTRVLIDVDVGMHRTGVPLEGLFTFYRQASQLEGLSVKGLHCYDGHRTQRDYVQRLEACGESKAAVEEIRALFAKAHIPFELIVAGGSATFLYYVDVPYAYLSPGTIFLNDYGHAQKFPDLDYVPAAAILTRVISCPLPGHFTLDLGYKGIASDPVGLRGCLVGYPHAEELFQSEEHWAYRMQPGYEKECPKVGEELYVIPTHICPTSQLYPQILVNSGGVVSDFWQVTARNRKITY